MITFNNIDYFPIPSFEEYFISNNGKIFSKKSNKFLKSWINKKGYESIDLVKNSKRYKFRIHSLVAATFIGEKKIGLHTRHLDGNKLNNFYKNLAYGTQSDNEKDSVKHGTHYRNTKITIDQAKQIAKDTRPYQEIANEFNLTRNYISDIKSGIYWKRETEGIRFQRGRKCPINKKIFTKEQILQILDKNNPRSKLVKDFGVSIHVIKRIRNQGIPNT
jgi:hypothetical protein